MMTKNQIQTAINEGIPFRIRMADGQQYDVSDRYQIALGPASVVVVDPEGGRTHPAVADDDRHQQSQRQKVG